MMEQLAETIQSILAPLKLVTYVGSFPTLSSEGISLRLIEGKPPQRYLGQEEAVFQPYLLVSTRSSTYPVGATWLQSIRETLDSYGQESVLQMQLITPLLYIGKNEQKMHEFQAVYKIMIKE